jgi:ABC-type dipeptide/oligopeptide/nickel transport system ATPase subunit
LNTLIDKNTDEYKKNNLVLDEIKNNDKYFELQKSITEKTKQYDDLYNSELVDLQYKKDQYSKKIISDDVIEEHTTEIDDLNEYIQTIEKYKTLTNEKSSIVKSLQKIISKHTTSLNLSDHPISDNSIQYIDTILTTVDDKITNLSETIEKLVVDINKIKLMGKRYKCPECSVGLSFCSKTNELILFHKDSEHNEDLEDVLVKKRKSLSKYTELSETVKKHKTQLINIEKNIQKIVDTYELEDLNITDSEIDDIRVSIKELQEKIYTNKETIISYKNIDEKLCDKTLMNHMLKQISKEISTLSKEFDSLPKPKIHNVDKSELLEKTTKLKFEINRYNTLSKDLKRISHELYSIEKVTSSPEKLTMKSISKHIELNNNERENNVMQKSNMIQQQHDIATWKVKHEQYCIYETRKTELNELENTIKEIKDKLQSIYKLKDYIKKAENILLERAIDQINTYVANYLDIFFQTDPINVNLCTRYDEKSSSKNGQLTLTIDYKGMDADLSILSGGELQRVVIAYNLALSELFSVPMILLDECTSNLDQELTEIVVKGIKRNCGEKTMIMIAHQVVSGIFDTTVEIQ